LKIALERELVAIPMPPGNPAMDAQTPKETVGETVAH
jgi:hypothetical protein